MLELDRFATQNGGLLWLLAVGAIAILFLIGSGALYATLLINGVLTIGNALISLGATAPAVAGTYVGAYARRFIKQNTFEIVLLTVLIIIGANLIRRALA